MAAYSIARQPRGMPNVYVQTEVDLTVAFKRLVTGHTFVSRELRVLLIAESGRLVEPAMQFTELGSAPEPQLLLSWIDQISADSYRLAPRGTVGVLYARPGLGPMRRSDSVWARTLTTVMRRQRIAAWPVHFANDAYLRVTTAADLAA